MDTPTPQHCANCRRLVVRRIEIVGYNRDGVRVGSADVCSLPCLVRWGTQGAALAVVRGVAGLAAAADALSEILRGPR